jgi:flagellar P-ring protein precursor FlgI
VTMGRATDKKDAQPGRSGKISLLSRWIVAALALPLAAPHLPAQTGTVQNPAGNAGIAELARGRVAAGGSTVAGSTIPVAQGATSPAREPLPRSAPMQESLIKDISSVQGIRDNQLIGYGIVVGLQNTGDSQMTYFPLQTLLSTLQRLGIVVPYPLTTIMVKNMAGVFVEATLPPFAQPGGRIDVTVSSTGDARSLTGGMLLMSPLYGADGQIYAEAQGPLVVGGYSISLNGNTKQMNFPTTARIPNGGIVERAVPVDILHRRTLTLMLNEADFETATQMAGAINRSFGATIAHAIDSRRVDLAVADGQDVPIFLARVQSLPVHVFAPARVVVNERTGTVVIGGNVRLQPVSILHGGLQIDVQTEFQVSQPNAFAGGNTEVVPQTQVQANNLPVNRIELKSGATVDDLVRSLQSIGASATDVISILQAMKQAGSLEGDLEVI